jgi:hypothetical protein
MGKIGETDVFTVDNKTDWDHPFHLHGHSFRVLGKPGALNLTDPVLKDTINVPAKSEVVVQWLADNAWFERTDVGGNIRQFRHGYQLACFAQDFANVGLWSPGRLRCGAGSPC